MEQANGTKIGCIAGAVIVLPIFIWVAVSLGSILSKSKTVYIYNPHESVLTLNIGNDEYKLKPFEKRKVSLSGQSYKVLSSINDEVIWDTTMNITSNILNKGGVINLSGQPLYKLTEFYGSPAIERVYALNDSIQTSSPLNQIKESGMDFIQIDSSIFYGNIVKFDENHLVIIKSWDYGIDENFEEKVTTNNHQDAVFGKAMSKLFDKSGVISYLEKSQ